MSLSVADFPAFHQAVHNGLRPFPWQERLLRKIVTERAWPRVLDLPTGSGKTTCIDIALFALALDASNPPQERWCPRRIALIVDRRVVVDHAAERGRKLLKAIMTSKADEVKAVREALAILAGPDESPLGVFTLRGGIPKDDGWTRTPDQPLIIASTVDQMGSRLLMQGYGVSPGMRPVHAGLAGNDVLILLDEAHLSQPFRNTLERLVDLRKRFKSGKLPQRFQFAFLSATPRDRNEERFCLSDEELAPDSALGPRLHAKKPTRIVEVSGREELAKQMVCETRRLIEKHYVVGVVVNRVDTALKVFHELKGVLPAKSDIVVLTGRMRPLDRDDVLAKYLPRIAAGLRSRSSEEGKLVVVATQCIEAGADFDFDAMVTESASFDSLRQRFGRVNRLGHYTDEAGRSRAEGVIIHDKDSTTPKRDKRGRVVRRAGKVEMVKGDPIYGDSIIETVRWLKSQLTNSEGKKSKAPRRTGLVDQTVDFGCMSLRDAPEKCLSPKDSAPALLPAYLDLWCQTAPEPTALPDPALFLHGLRRGLADVQIIWRTDLDPGQFETEAPVSVVSALRPSSLEAISLPFVTAQRWLMGMNGSLPIAADLEVNEDEREEEAPLGKGRRALRWRGDRSETVDASLVRPGDTLVVPSSYGGIDPYSRCFDPGAQQEVSDLAERASLMGRGRPLLRLHPRVLLGLDLSVEHSDPEEARRYLAAKADELSGWRRLWAERLARGRQAYFVPCKSADGEGWFVIVGRRVRPEEMRDGGWPADWMEGSGEPGIETSSEEEESPYIGSEVSLADHTGHVEKRVRRYAERLGFPHKIVEDLALAGRLHDIGKADRRFQCMLRGGSLSTYYRDGEKILAKSGIPCGSMAERQRAQRLSGYPFGARHELQSLAMLEAVRSLIEKRAHDFDLVMHLIASHHGFCRPFAPVVEDLNPVQVQLEGHEGSFWGEMSFRPVTSDHKLFKLDSAIADRFWSLVARYGWLELCWLETALRLADHRASEAETGE